MAEIRDQLVLDISAALREVNELEAALTRAFAETQVSVDTDLVRRQLDQLETDLQGLEADQLAASFDDAETAVRRTVTEVDDLNRTVTLTTDEYRQAVRLMEEGETATRAIAVATGQVQTEARQAEDAYRRIATSLNLSEDEARQLSTSIARSTVESSELDADLRRVATSLGLSEDQAREFANQTRRAAQATSEADRETRNLSTSWQRARGFIVAAVAAIGVRGIIDQFNQAVQASANLAESQNAVNVVFGEAARIIFPAAEEAATRFGLSTRALNENATQLGSSLQNAGFSAEEAARLFLVLQERASDTASVLNTDVNEVLVALQAALRGEFDPIERFTGGMNQAAVEAEALSQGLIGQGEALTNNARALAVTSLFLERTNRFAGDFANTSDSVANRQRTLRAAFEDTRAVVGEALIPAFEALLSLTPQIIEVIEDLSPAIADAAQSFSDLLTSAAPVFDRLSQIQQGFGLLGDVSTAAVTPIRQSAEVLASLAAGDFGRTIQNIGELGEAYGDLIDRVQDRGVIIAFNEALLAGVDPADALNDALEKTADLNEITFESFDRLAGISGLTDEALRDVTEAILDNADALGLTDDEVDVLRIRLGRLNTELNGLADVVRTRALINFDRLGNSTETVGNSAETAALQLQALHDGLDTLQRVADQSGVSLQTVIDNASRFGPEVATIVAELGPAALETEAFAQALDQLDTSIDLDFSDAVQEFDLLLSTVNDAGDQVPTTMEQMLADLQQQAENFARLELNVAILQALGLDALAAEILSRGPEAVEASQQFVEDIESALRAESLLDEGAALGESEVLGLQQAIAQGDITPAFLEQVKGFTSSQIQQAIADAAIINAGVYGAEFQEALSRLAIRLDVPVRFLEENIVLPSTGSISGSGTSGGTSGGGTTVNNNFFTAPNPTTDTQRITQTTSGLFR